MSFKTNPGPAFALTHTAPYRKLPVRLIADADGMITIPTCDIAKLCGLGTGHRAVRNANATARTQIVGTDRGIRPIKTKPVPLAVEFVRKHGTPAQARWLAREAIRLDNILNPAPSL